MAIQKILCPVDFSDSSRAAQRVAVRLAELTGASLEVVHVIQPVYTIPPNGGFALDGMYEALSRGADEGLAASKADIAALAPKVAVQVTQIQGTPWDRVCHEARRGGFDLVVMGTHGRSGIRHALLGSVAERVVRHAPCPVLVVREPPAQETLFRDILCAVDFSEPSRGALRMAADLAKATGATLTLIHVYTTQAPTRDAAIEAEIERLRPVLAEWQAEAKARGAPRLQIAWEEGVPWQAVVRRARDERNDLIVVGTHGRTGLEHVLVGSVAERVIRYAPCSVLAVRKPRG